jgi:hypothetical protein
VVFSWNEVEDQRPHSKVDAYGAVFAINAEAFETTSVYMVNERTEQMEFTIGEENIVKVSLGSFNLDYVQGIGYWYFNNGEAVTNLREVLSLARFMPIFPDDPMGVYFDYETVSGTVRYVNNNVYMDVFDNDIDKKPGRMLWGQYGRMPALNEYFLNENILKIAPIKSFQPTDERNTVLIWTADNLYRLALIGTSAQESVVIRDYPGLGISHKDAFAEILGGYAWLHKNEAYIITADGINPISKDRVVIDDTWHCIFDKYRKWLFVIGDDTDEPALIYDIENNEWLTGYAEYSVTGFHKITNDLRTAIIDDKLKDLDPAGEAPVYEAGEIITGYFPAMQKIKRIKIVSDSYASGVESFDITAYVQTRTAPTTTPVTVSSIKAVPNKWTSFPNLKGDYVYFKIASEKNCPISYFKVEY